MHLLILGGILLLTRSMSLERWQIILDDERRVHSSSALHMGFAHCVVS